MTEDEQLIIAGDNAEALLENPAFDSAFQSLVDTLNQMQDSLVEPPHYLQ